MKLEKTEVAVSYQTAVLYIRSSSDWIHVHWITELYIHSASNLIYLGKWKMTTLLRFYGCLWNYDLYRVLQLVMDNYYFLFHYIPSHYYYSFCVIDGIKSDHLLWTYVSNPVQKSIVGREKYNIIWPWICFKNNFGLLLTCEILCHLHEQLSNN